MVAVIPEELPAIVLVGELKEGQPAWNLPFDPFYRYTDGLYRSLFMRLQRIISGPEFKFEKTYSLGTGEEVFLIRQTVFDSSRIFCVLLREGEFDNKLISAITKIAERGGIYEAKKFYHEVKDTLTIPEEALQIETLIPQEGLTFIKRHNWDEISLYEMASILVIIGTDPECVKGEILIEFTMKMLSSITNDMDPDVMLDSAFVIASRYMENQDFDNASLLFDKIADYASDKERLALEISSRIRSARIIKLQGDNTMAILDVLSPIDDGSLEVASNDDREEYYCLQAFAFSEIDVLAAEDLYSMAILISEEDSFPTMNIAEARAFIGTRAADSYNPKIATREFITAASIATRNGQPDMTMFYSHLAAKQELKWSNYLASAAIENKIDANIENAEYMAWQSLKRLINSFIHADPKLRADDLTPEWEKIVDMNNNVFTAGYNQHSIETMREIEEQLKIIQHEEKNPDIDTEMLKFLASKVSAKIPLPTPIIMLIANDGRLILGGDVGTEDWEEAISDSDELFSGALSAIMAVLSEVTASTTPLRMVDAGTTQIMIEKSKVCIGALLVDREINVIRKALNKVVEILQYQYPDLENWDGYSIDLSEIRPMVNEVFAVAMKELSE